MMTNEERERLNAVIAKIKENTIEAWQTDLVDTKPVAILGDFMTGDGYRSYGEGDLVKYNGWLEDLTNLVK